MSEFRERERVTVRRGGTGESERARWREGESVCEREIEVVN